MEEKRIIKFIRKAVPFIFIICILISVFIAISLTKQRTYVASAVINYNFESAEKGKTPSGDDLDVNEIKSSAIMSKVIESAGLSSDYSVDNLTSRIGIIEVPDEDKLSQKQAKLDEGEEYVYVPTKYIITFTASNNEGENFARTMLDEILDTYFSVFGENYINVDHISNKIEKMYDDNYDYLQMMEYVETCIADTVDLLYQRDSSSPYYRSTETGKSFNDLVEYFNFMKSVKVSELLSRIYKYQITKDKNVLVANYTTRMDNNAINAENERGMLADVEEVINAYVFKMRESGNTNIDADYILKDVYDRDLKDGSGNQLTAGDQTVTYDQLIYAWRDHNLNDRLDEIDTGYCHFVINTFNACTGNCGGACSGANKTCTELSNANYANIEKELDAEIKDLVDELTVLYDDAVKTCDEYNEYLGCKNIQVLSTVSTEASINVKLYSTIAFIFLVVVCCGGALLIGRFNSIIVSTFYTDPITGLRNRAYFDKFLAKKGKHNLDDGTVMVSIMITNIHDINDKHGRDMGNKVLKYFAEEIKYAFAKMDAFFVYNGNNHYFVTLNKTDIITAEDALQMFRTSLDTREELQNVRFEYKIGVAETFRNRVRSARLLLVEAIKNNKNYVTESKTDEKK